MDSLRLRLACLFSTRSKIVEIILRAEIFTQGNNVVIRCDSITDAIYLAKNSKHISLRLYSLGYRQELKISTDKSIVLIEPIETTCMIHMRARVERVLIVA